jgi:hypothetical protein
VSRDSRVSESPYVMASFANELTLYIVIYHRFALSMKDLDFGVHLRHSVVFAISYLHFLCDIILLFKLRLFSFLSTPSLHSSSQRTFPQYPTGDLYIL